MRRTSNFHLLIGEMTITLNDVACLLGIPITERLLHDRELTRGEGIQMMQEDLLFTAEAAAKEVGRQGAAHVSFGKLRRRYQELFNRCNHLVEPDTKEKHEEQAQVRLAYIKAFLLLSLGWTIFSARTAEALFCCGCLRCKIWSSWAAGHGAR
jgi:hypothetical protein